MSKKEKKTYISDYRITDRLKNIKKIVDILLELKLKRKPGTAEESFEYWVEEIESNIESIKEIAKIEIQLLKKAGVGVSGILAILLLPGNPVYPFVQVEMFSCETVSI